MNRLCLALENKVDRSHCSNLFCLDRSLTDVLETVPKLTLLGMALRCGMLVAL